MWNISGIRFPTVGVDGAKPELPLKVSLYRPSPSPHSTPAAPQVPPTPPVAPGPAAH